jgi:hypothetical protein
VATSAARILNGVTDGASTVARLLNNQGEWDRRAQDWQHEIDLYTIEILASRRRRAFALRDLNIHNHQMEHSAGALDFLRDKFTKQELYLFLQQETAALYEQSYNLVMKAARDAQQALWYERGDVNRDFLKEAHWETLHEGLMAGERPEFALQAMVQSYMDLNCRSPFASTSGSHPYNSKPAAPVRSKSQNGCSTSTTQATICAASKTSP